MAELVRQAQEDLARSKCKAAWEREKKFIEKWMLEAARRAPTGTGRGWRREDAYDRKDFARQ
jgi:hypothetical protein